MKRYYIKYNVQLFAPKNTNLMKYDKQNLSLSKV